MLRGGYGLRKGDRKVGQGDGFALGRNREGGWRIRQPAGGVRGRDLGQLGGAQPSSPPRKGLEAK